MEIFKTSTPGKRISKDTDLKASSETTKTQQHGGRRLDQKELEEEGGERGESYKVLQFL